MRIIIYVLLLGVVLISSCEDKNDPKTIAPGVEVIPTEPVIIEIQVNGSNVSILWDHDSENYNVVYNIYINDIRFPDPPKFFTRNLSYDSLYRGSIQVTYPGGQTVSTAFEFETPKSKILLLASNYEVFAYDLNLKSQIWSRSIEQSPRGHGPLYVENNRVYFGSDSIVSIDIKSGNIFNEYPLGYGSIKYTTPFQWKQSENALLLDLRYFEQRYLGAFQTQSGTFLWPPIPVVQFDYDNGKLITQYNGIESRNPLTGEILWQTVEIDGLEPKYIRNISSFVIDNDEIIFTDEDGNVVNLSAEDGSLNWFIDIYEDYLPTNISVKADNENIYVPVFNQLYCLNRHDGTVKWVRPFPMNSFIHSINIGTNELLVWTWYNNHVYCLNLTNGTVRWDKDLGTAFGSKLALFHENIIYTNLRPFSAIDAETGEVLWQINECCNGGNGAVLVVGDYEEVFYPN